jgi:transposase
MKSVAEFDGVYIHKTPVDFRKSINGLSDIVQNELSLNPFEKLLFVFICRDRKKIKILYWDESGFALWYKRLEKERFPWPGKEDTVMTLSPDELSWLLSGIDLWKIAPHKKLKFDQV